MTGHRNSTTADLQALFTPFKLRALELANRFVVPAMQRGASVGGRPPSALIDNYTRLIRGGFSLIIAESCAIDHTSASHKESVLRMNRDTLSAWRSCVRSVRDAGGNILIQLWHEGAQREEIRSGPYANASTLSPSGLLTATRPRGRAITAAELKELSHAYLTSARIAQDVGAQGIELHAGHGYLLDQFLWSDTNRREDGYGGAELAARARFPAEVAADIRRITGEDFVISLRFSQWKVRYEHLTPIIDSDAQIVRSPNELEEMLIILKKAGVDLFHVSTRRFDKPEWPPDTRSLAGWTKAVSSCPVIAVGGVGGDNDAAEKQTNIDAKQRGHLLVTGLEKLATAFAERQFDLVAVGRASIGDPDWPNKVKAGRFAEIRPFGREQLQEIRNQIT